MKSCLSVQYYQESDRSSFLTWQGLSNQKKNKCEHIQDIINVQVNLTLKRKCLPSARRNLKQGDYNESIPKDNYTCLLAQIGRHPLLSEILIMPLNNDTTTALLQVGPGLKAKGMHMRKPIKLQLSSAESTLDPTRRTVYQESKVVTIKRDGSPGT